MKWSGSEKNELLLNKEEEQSLPLEEKILNK